MRKTLRTLRYDIAAIGTKRLRSRTALRLDIAGVVIEDFLAEVVAVDVEVDLGGGDALVAEHLLDGTQVRAAFEEMGGEAVAEGVGGDGGADACGATELLDDVEDGDAGEGRTAADAQEDIILGAGLDGDACAVVEPVLQFRYGTGRDGHEPLLLAFAVHTDEALVEEEVAHLQMAELTDAEPAGVEGLQNGAVALALGLGHIDGVDEEIDLADGEHVGEVAAA